VFFSPVVLAAGEAACDAQNIMFRALSLDRAEKVKTVQIGGYKCGCNPLVDHAV
jgi:hypothetical protein